MGERPVAEVREVAPLAVFEIRVVQVGRVTLDVDRLNTLRG